MKICAKLLKKVRIYLILVVAFHFFCTYCYKMWNNSTTFTPQTNNWTKYTSRMKYRKIISFLLAAPLVVFCVSCAENVEQLAKPYLERAELSYSNGQYSLAKLQLDSIKTLYPTAFDARTKAQTLLLHIDLTESQRNLYYIDSLLVLSREKLPALTENLYFDKHADYQDVGTYYASQHRIERNVGRTYMRPQTDEKGVHTIIVYHRGKAIEPHTLRFAAPDATFVELVTKTPPHTWSDASGSTERVDFAVGSEESVAAFLAMHADKTIKVELVGAKGKTAIPCAKADKQAIIDVSNLSATLRAITDLEKKWSEANRRLEFVQHRLQADSIKRETAAQEAEMGK